MAAVAHCHVHCSLDTRKVLSFPLHSYFVPLLGRKVYTAPILGATRFELYIGRVTKSVFTRRYKLFLSLLISTRENKGLSQRALSAKLKKTPTYVSKYERGERRLDVVEFLDIVKILDADACEIIKEIGD